MQVIGLWRYPVKSLQGEALDTSVFEPDGFEGDRRWGIRDSTTGRILTARRRPELLHASASYVDGRPVITLPTGRTTVGPGAATDGELSAWLGSPVSLVAAADGGAGRAEFFKDPTDDTSRAIEWTMPEGRFVDAAALLVVTTASLRAARALHPAGDWETRRFRPNLLVDVAEDGWVEDGWIGRSLQAGTAVLAPTEGCIRCTMVTREQPGTSADQDIFRVLAKHHGARLGVWCEVTTTGCVSVGDRLALASSDRP